MKVKSTIAGKQVSQLYTGGLNKLEEYIIFVCYDLSNHRGVGLQLVIPNNSDGVAVLAE